jgi:hypothetical protein
VRRLGRRAKERSARRGAPAKASQGEPGSEAQGSVGLYIDPPPGALCGLSGGGPRRVRLRAASAFTSM